MRSAIILVTLMVMAVFYVLADAVPPSSSLPGGLLEKFDPTDTGVSMVSMSKLFDPHGLSSVPDLNPDIYNNKQRCYSWYDSERWENVGGQHSQFVNDTIFGMCEFITAYTNSAGWDKDATVSDSPPATSADSPTSADYWAKISICTDIDSNTQVSEGSPHNLRSIAVVVTYRGASNGPMDLLRGFGPYYCLDILSAAMDCGAGGEFIMQYGDTPRCFFEAKADPNKGDCSENGYELILQSGS